MAKGRAWRVGLPSPPLCRQGRGWAVALAAEPSEAPPADPDRAGDDPTAGTTMFYASGTPGKPKGTVRRADGRASTAALLGIFGWTTEEVYLSTGPLYHSAPLGFMLAVQALGGSVIVQRHFDPEAWLRLVDRHKVTPSF